MFVLIHQEFTTKNTLRAFNYNGLLVCFTANIYLLYYPKAKICGKKFFFVEEQRQTCEVTL